MQGSGGFSEFRALKLFRNLFLGCLGLAKALRGCFLMLLQSWRPWETGNTNPLPMIITPTSPLILSTPLILGVWGGLILAGEDFKHACGGEFTRRGR